jgi:hypothetical protein
MNDIPDNVRILASSAEEGEMMSTEARLHGSTVKGMDIWTGPVPPHSFYNLSPTCRMSNENYFFLRKATWLPFVDAVRLGCELCGHYATSLTQHDKEEGVYEYLYTKRTDKKALERYLRPIRHTKEGRRALGVLDYVREDEASPMSTYLYLLLCMPAEHGGYGFKTPLPCGAYQTNEGFLPAADGTYLIYDVAWQDEKVAVQYTGRDLPNETDMAALETQGMRVVCVTDTDLETPEAFRAIASAVADALGATMPTDEATWHEKHAELMASANPRRYHAMRLVMNEIERHKQPC